MEGAMPEGTEAATAETTTETETTETSEQTLGDAGKRALERERDARKRAEAEAKANADAAKRLAEIEESQKTETQKLNDKLAQATAQNGDLQLENSRLRVALRHGLTEDQARRLIGSSEDELDADAEQLKETLGLNPPEEETTATPPTPPQRPVRSGSQPPATPLNGDPLEQALKRKLGIR